MIDAFCIAIFLRLLYLFFRKLIYSVSYLRMIYYSFLLILLLLYTSLFKMVRNTKGGKGAKSMARKSFAPSASSFPVPTCDMEHLAVVSHMYGPSCDVLLLDGTKLLCHIRNKFKGRHKSGNLILVGSILLIGYRDWESDTARKNCDLLFVYDNLQASSLADRFPIPAIPSISSRSASISSPTDIIFDNSTFTYTNDDTTNTFNTTTDTNTSLDFDDL